MGTLFFTYTAHSALMRGKLEVSDYTDMLSKVTALQADPNTELISMTFSNQTIEIPTHTGV